MKKTILVKVSTVETEFDFNIILTTIGQQLFEQINKTLNIREVWWFGLQHVDSKEMNNWLKLKNKISSQDIKGIKQGGPISFRYKPRFYPEDAAIELIQDSTKRLFFEQVRRDILDDEIYCPAEASVLLASYAAQAHYDDYSPEKEAFLFKDQLCQRILKQHDLKPEQWAHKIATWWKDHSGMLREDAMLEYLRIAQDLEMYGVNYFRIKNKKGTDLFLGVDTLGLNIYEQNDQLTPKIGFPWSEIRNVSFHDKKFSIKSVDKKAPDFVFFSARTRMNKQILALCMGNHDLYSRRRRGDTIDMLQMKAQAEEDKKFKLSERERFQREKMSREEAERRLEELERQLKSQTDEFNRSRKSLDNYEDRIRGLEERLQDEARQRQELEELKDRLQRSNQALESNHNSASEDFKRLREENEKIQQEIRSKDDEIAASSNELTNCQKEIERLRQEQEDLRKLAQTSTTRIVHEEHSGKSSALSSKSLSSETLGHDFEESENGLDHSLGDGSLGSQPNNRNEENRETALEKDVSMQQKLSQLQADLHKQRLDSKLEPADVLHEENRRQGRDKFKTLKQIRQGNTKKRIDAFESM